jgi:hypothetical protein
MAGRTFMGMMLTGGNARRCQMRKGLLARKIMFVGLVVAALGSSTGARSARLVGAVASVTPNSLEVMTKSEGTKAVRLDRSTQYMKWITHKPWQESQQADFTSLAVERCVEVDLRSADTNEAKMVWVSTEPSGSIYDPCHGFRK